MYVSSLKYEVLFRCYITVVQIETGPPEMLTASVAWHFLSSGWAGVARLGPWAPGPLAREEEPAGSDWSHSDVWTATLCVQGFSL